MPTKEPRLNVVLDKETRGLLARLAKKQDTTLSHLAARLIAEGLEMQEDFYFSKLAQQRREEGGGRLSHEEFWKLAEKKTGK